MELNKYLSNIYDIFIHIFSYVCVYEEDHVLCVLAIVSAII